MTRELAAERRARQEAEAQAAALREALEWALSEGGWRLWYHADKEPPAIIDTSGGAGSPATIRTDTGKQYLAIVEAARRYVRAERELIAIFHGPDTDKVIELERKRNELHDELMRAVGGMTREQIEQLTGRELDAEVERRVFGRNAVMFSVHQTDEGDEVVRLDADGDVPTWAVLERDRLHPLRRFSTDIAAAFEVVEEMRRLGYTVVIRLQPEHHCDVCFRDGRGAWEAYSPSAPLAICRTALLARMGEEKA